MNLDRFNELQRAHRLLELAELQAERGDFDKAARKVETARQLIFGSAQQASPAQPAVAGASNTGSRSVKFLPM